MLYIDNLIFRKPTLSDAEVLCVLKNNANASRLLGGVPRSYSVEDIINWIQFHNENPDEILFVVVDSITEKIIGHVGLYKIDRITKKTEYGILIADDDSRGKGYGTKCTKIMVKYAFNELKMNKVTAEVISENAPSLAMFKKCGFYIDGCLRDDIYKNGRYYDVFSLSILAKEFVDD